MDRYTTRIVGGSLALLLLLTGAALMYYGQTRGGAILLATVPVCLAFALGCLRRCGCGLSGRTR